MLIEITYNVTDVFMSTTETPVYVEISFEQPSGSAAVWGSITGTLSNQTDLQTALDAKLDESTIDGGTEGQILSKASATDFDFAWINNYAKYLATNVRNQTGSTINAFQVVYISGATGNKPLISLADADTEATSSKTYGVTATAIANNGTGDVVTAGELSGINTSAFNEGDLLWLSTTAGGVVTSPPAEPAHSVFIGYVVRSHPTLGTIDVSIKNGYELNELHGVQITSAANNDGLFYNSSNSLWENKTISTALGYTPVPTTRNITINGVTYDLSADRTWTISAGISGSGASGQVTYWTGASAVSGSNNLFWDNTNRRLAVGTTLNSWGDFRVLQLGLGTALWNNSNANGTLLSSNLFNNGTNNIYINTGNATAYVQSFGSHGWYSSTSGTSGNIITLVEQMRLYPTGNLLIQNGGIFADSGQRLQVYGDTLLRGSGNASGTFALTVQNSDSTNILRIRNNGQIIANSGLTVGTINSGASIVPTGSAGSEGILLQSGILPTETNVIDISLSNGQGDGTFTSGTRNLVDMFRGFAPTSGTGVYNLLRIRTTINQTGGANGVTRGLYVNPTLTAAADWRSIEWSNNSGWGLYGAGTANNYLAGRLGIGNTNLSGSALAVRANLTGGVSQIGVLQSGTVFSDVTNTVRSFFSQLNTQASAFSLFEYYHFNAGANTLGAGSSISNQYGFTATSTLTGATNNYGFYGDIPSGTGRWNLYMNGTANNYVAGNFSIGTTSVTNWLNIAASTTAKAHINLVAGSTPTAPANGDIWFDGTDIKMRIGGVTKTFTLI